MEFVLPRQVVVHRCSTAKDDDASERLGESRETAEAMQQADGTSLSVKSVHLAH